jgi:hypothetical protein
LAGVWKPESSRRPREFAGGARETAVALGALSMDLWPSTRRSHFRHTHSSQQISAFGQSGSKLEADSEHTHASMTTVEGSGALHHAVDLIVIESAFCQHTHPSFDVLRLTDDTCKGTGDRTPRLLCT